MSETILEFAAKIQPFVYCAIAMIALLIFQNIPVGMAVSCLMFGSVPTYAIGLGMEEI